MTEATEPYEWEAQLISEGKDPERVARHRRLVDALFESDRRIGEAMEKQGDALFWRLEMAEDVRGRPTLAEANAELVAALRERTECVREACRLLGLDEPDAAMLPTNLAA